MAEKTDKEAVSAAVSELKKKLDSGEDISVADAVKLMASAKQPTAAAALARSKMLAGQTCDSFC